MTAIGSRPGREALTVLVPCGNEAANVRGCLESIAWADEILVVDSFSTDGSAEIAGEYTDRVLRHEYVNSAAQKNWAIPQARHEWVLVVDCDERVTPELRDEIRELLARGPDRDGYWIRRSNYLFGRPVRHSSWGADSVLRLFRRNKGRYAEKRVHSGIKLRDCGRLEGHLVHYSINSVEQWVAKINRYTTWKMQDKVERGFPAPLLQCLARPPIRFVKEYFFKLGVLDGQAGFLIAAMAAWAEFLLSAKVAAHDRQSRRRS